ncbi:hypothetical protein SAY86_012276 [Trapa natans]|uniref:Protein NRT1/ PTR FAMILY 2.8 n=1 Tax=Trapa natans TaxID=22666 RepID=A0AAN7R928_TRANT|nr:hypothetical protein SAY86_012276 [Trapa natans]
MEDAILSASSLEEREQDPPATAPAAATKAGGWNAIKYIIGNESFEKLASMSLIANITVYLRSQYNMDGVLVVNVVNIWSGCSNIASLAGAFISDAYLGRFRTLFFGSLASFLGMGTMTLTAGLSQLRPPECTGQSMCVHPQKWQLGILFGGLSLLALGAGGIRPCNIAFGADQFDTTTAKGRSQLECFFNWWYFSFTVALLIALIGVVYIQTNVSWAIGFAIPTLCLLLSISIFLLGRKAYICKKPQGSVFTDVAKVLVAATFKSRRNIPENFLYDPPPEEGEEAGRLHRTERFRFLDRAAVVMEGELDGQGKARNGWKLCCVQQVERLKCLIGIVPVWVSGIGCFITMDQQTTFGILQAIQMDKSIGRHFSIPPGWMTLTSMVALSIWIFVYEQVYIPHAHKISGRAKRLTTKQRIRIGILMSILCMIVAGVVEKIRRNSAIKSRTFVATTTVFLLLPQFVLSGMVEAFAAVAIMELLTTQMPESMRTVAGAVFFLSLSMASYIGSLLVNVIHVATTRGGHSPWLGGHDLNRNKLENYYYIIAAVNAFNFVYFTLFASRYVDLGRVQGAVQLAGSGS